MPEYNTWNAGFSFTYKVFTLDLRYVDTDLSKSELQRLDLRSNGILQRWQRHRHQSERPWLELVRIDLRRQAVLRPDGQHELEVGISFKKFGATAAKAGRNPGLLVFVKVRAAPFFERPIFAALATLHDQANKFGLRQQGTKLRGSRLFLCIPRMPASVVNLSLTLSSVSFF